MIFFMIYHAVCSLISYQTSYKFFSKKIMYRPGGVLYYKKYIAVILTPRSYNNIMSIPYIWKST